MFVIQWSPENKHVQRLYISTLLEKLEYLVENWSEDHGQRNNAQQAAQEQTQNSGMKAVLFPTRRTEDIGRLNSHTVINIEGLVTRVRAIQVIYIMSYLIGIPCKKVIINK